MKEASKIKIKYLKEMRDILATHARLKELLAIKRDAQAILDDDTVNSWMLDKESTREYTEAEVKQAAEDYNNVVKEIDLIIENL